jgi:hypothetical protein
MPQQPGLFDNVVETIPAHHLYGHSDPDTSAEAAEAIQPRLSELREWVADCVAKSPGKTGLELAHEFCPNDLARLRRRLNECAKLNMIRRGEKRNCGISGHKAETWYPPEQ